MEDVPFFPPLGDSISIASDSEFSRVIQEIDFTVGADRKTSDFRERFTVGQFLLTLWSNCLLEYPLVIEKRETPDLLWRQGAREVGAEITEGTTQQFRAGIAVHDRRFPSQPFFPSDFSNTASDRGGWYGQNAELEWADIMLGSAIAKAEGYSASAKPFDEMMLLIFSNTPGGNGLEDGNFDGTRVLLSKRLQETGAHQIISPIFRAVHVVYGSHLITDLLTDAEVVSPPEIQWKLRDRSILKCQMGAIDRGSH